MIKYVIFYIGCHELILFSKKLSKSINTCIKKEKEVLIYKLVFRLEVVLKVERSLSKIHISPTNWVTAPSKED